MTQLTQVLFPLVFSDVALFSVIEGELCVLLICRDNEPEQGKWALAGGILKPQIDTSLEATASRVIKSKAGVEVDHLEVVAVVSGEQRDPRGYSVSVLYSGLVRIAKAEALAGLKTRAVQWFPTNALPETGLAFDHAEMIALALAQLREKLRHRSLPLHVLNEEFTLSELQDVCSVVLDERIDKSSFRRRMKQEPFLVAIDGKFRDGQHRPAQLYSAAPSFKF
jgi:8-oxo-dGTP diphosphatase